MASWGVLDFPQDVACMSAPMRELVGRRMPATRGETAPQQSVPAGEPAGAVDQQTFIDRAEDRDCAHGVFIVIGCSMSGMQRPCGRDPEIRGPR